MGYPTSTVVTGIISLSDITDTYATHWAYLGKGGQRSIDTVANRNLIPSARREFGMLVTVNADGTALNNTTWMLANVALGGTNNTITDNANWIVSTSTSLSGTLNNYAIFTPDGTHVGNGLLSQDGTNVIIPNGKFITGANIAKTRIGFGTSGDAFVVQSTAGSNNTNFNIQNNSITGKAGDGGGTLTESQFECIRQYSTYLLSDLATGSKSGLGIQDNSGAALSMEGGVQVKLATTNVAITENATSRWALFLNAKNASYNVGVTNSVVIGGVNQAATTSNTVYVPNLEIQATKTLKYSPGSEGVGKIIQDSGAGTGIMTWVAPTTTLSGTYTPTLFNVANLDASTAYSCQYMQVGNTVTVSGKVGIDPTLAATDTQLGMSIPVATNLTADGQAGGVAFSNVIAGMGAAIMADAANDRVTFQWKSADVTATTMWFTFTYRLT